MAKPRPRYIALSRIRLNDVEIEGQELALVGMCDMYGQTKGANGKKKAKKYLTHYKLRFEDKKWLKENNILNFLYLHISPDSLSRFFELKDAKE